MKSNGFGRFEQRIIVHIDQQYASLIESQNGGVSRWKFDGRRTFVWSRLSTRKGDDEGIVSHLSTLLKDLPESAWNIDWKRSQY
ncbi:hypothetical protein [Agrobacterium sp. CFBP2214]|uniref:hypothetical protein n=1 Tax=Agrobacterium sp. CFBP2214 TaxID=3040274 RepID=UPI000DD0B405|nr:hypothetical protein [Agrobacterium sp. CFBP2214]